MLKAGQVLIWAGDPAAVCANLVSGVLKVVREDPDSADAGRARAANRMLDVERFTQ